MHPYPVQRSIPACAGEPVERIAPGVHPGVYPRVCGGTVPPPGDKLGVAGLSPRVRGNRRRTGGCHAPDGSIPACAGEPRSTERSDRARGVYPRVCGGTRSLSSDASSAPGLSPRVRGNHVDSPPDDGDDRSIPACAGEPAAGPSLAKDARVYPRVCGGTGVTAFFARGGQGLSPRVRGNLVAALAIGFVVWSIPACAGEPAGTASSTWRCGVYPRVCGGTCPA